MGLDLHCAVSKKSYHASYHALHWVRWLALVACGWPRKLGTGQYAETMSTHFYVIPTGLNGDELTMMIFASQRAGYLFPNLLLHSDCEGSYTKNGKVDPWKCMRGNSTKLLAELKLLETLLPEDLKVNEQRGPWSVYKMLREVVEDEVVNGKGSIRFC